MAPKRTMADVPSQPGKRRAVGARAPVSPDTTQAHIDALFRGKKAGAVRPSTRHIP